ncbi:Similar to CG4666: Protein THEM6 (Drosophila melanogaster) [Cotesia congregata]|uniref:Protein THEM6 n=1 Tax=Cotesia congregata TaxID=51543 RepID=A0A8J2H7C2_COTCN|nr:Similar to CG4666: Protein THEM6 (Drosophila melanogaster) [Cotesia congregata]
MPCLSVHGESKQRQPHSWYFKQTFYGESRTRQTVLGRELRVQCACRICTSQDVDIFLKHMNNARYLRELDFARFHYYDRSGIYGEVSRRGGGAVQGASSTRYRRALPIFTPYKVTTQLIYWDEKNFYLEHEFISLSDNFVRAVVLSKQTVTGLKVPVSEVIAKVEPSAQRPEMSNELKLWLDSMEESSQKLKKRS